MTVVSFTESAKSENIIHVSFAPEDSKLPTEPSVSSADGQSANAIVYCEGNFGLIDGKTANGLVRHSQRYKIISIIDSHEAGRDAGEVLDGRPNGIPVFGSLEEAFANTSVTRRPDYFIYGMAPATGMLSPVERRILLDALEMGMNVVNGLHEFLSDDPEFVTAGLRKNVEVIDIRKPRAKNNLRMFNGDIAKVSCPTIAVLGTDCAIGKRTTSNILTRALVERGIRAVMITTGQTGIMQGSRYGVALDAVPSQFCCGELEATIFDAFNEEDPDIIIVEGQGALSHPAFSTSSFILRGSVPDGVILQHAPKRLHRCDFEDMKMPTPDSEIRLIEAFSDTKVIGLTINHENMSDIEIDTEISSYKEQLGLPVTDALARPVEQLVDMVLKAFPDLERKLTVSAE